MCNNPEILLFVLFPSQLLNQQCFAFALDTCLEMQKEKRCVLCVYENTQITALLAGLSPPKMEEQLSGVFLWRKTGIHAACKKSL